MKLNQSILTLSSGTLASISGFRKYDDIDVVSRSFEEYSAKLSQDMVWQDAWHLYEKSNEWELCRTKLSKLY